MSELAPPKLTTPVTLNTSHTITALRELLWDTSGAVPPVDYVPSHKLIHPETMDADELLLWADFTADHAPSRSWLPAFAGLLVGCHQRIPEWHVLTDRLDYMSTRIPSIDLPPVVLRGIHDVISSIALEWVSEFPFGPIGTSDKLEELILETVHRDEFLGTALKLSDEIYEETFNTPSVRSIIEEWSTVILSEERSASWLSSVMLSWLRDAVRPPIYDADIFVAGSTCQPLLKAHFAHASDLIERTCPRIYFDWMQTQFAK